MINKYSRYLTTTMRTTLLAVVIGGSILPCLGQGINPTAVMIAGEGMFVVKNPDNGDISYTRMGTYQQDAKGLFTNDQGQVLQYFKADANGAAIGFGATAFDQLYPLDAKDLAFMPAIPTSTLSVFCNLPADTFIMTSPPTYSTTFDVMDALSITRKFTATFTKVTDVAEANLNLAPEQIAAWRLSIAEVNVLHAPSTIDWPYGSNATPANGDAGLLVVFDNTGNLNSLYTTTTNAGVTTKTNLSGTPSPVGIQCASPSSAKLNIALNLGSMGMHNGMRLCGRDAYTIKYEHNGKPAGQFIYMFFGEDGKISGRYTNGSLYTIGWLPLATFNHVNYVYKIQDGHYIPTASSGAAMLRMPGDAGVGKLNPGKLDCAVS